MASDEHAYSLRITTQIVDEDGSRVVQNERTYVGPFATRAEASEQERQVRDLMQNLRREDGIRD